VNLDGNYFEDDRNWFSEIVKQKVLEAQPFFFGPCMFVALVIKHAMCMCHIAYLRTVRLYMFVLPYLINGAILW